MNQRFTKRKFKVNMKIIMIIIFLSVIVFGLSGCRARYYRGDYPELFTVALNSLLGARGVANNEIDDPRIIVLEEDNYGRTLFMYGEGRGIGISILVSQKSDGNYVYFYPHHNFIIFETREEMTSRESLDGVQMRHFHPEIIEKIDELKERNDWNQELDLENSVKKEIDVSRRPQGPISRNTLEEALGIAWNNGEERELRRGTFVFLTTDDYGRSVYLWYRMESKRAYRERSGVSYWRSYLVGHIVLLFQPNGSFDEQKGFMDLEDIYHYQTALREFKERNDWNQPFEAPTSIPLRWIMVAVLVVIGVGGLLGVQRYLRSRREVCWIIWLPIMKEDNLGQLLIALGSKLIDALVGRLRKLFSLFPIGKGKRRVYSLLYIIMPSLLANVVFFQPQILPRFLWIPFWNSVLILYLVTVVGIVLFFRFRPCEFNVLILGLILPSIFPFIYVVIGMEASAIFIVFLLFFFFRLFGPMFLFYSLLFIAISILVKKFIKLD